MFSFADIDNFDSHISKSIKGYDELNDNIVKISEYFIESGTNVYDIGCSTGKLLSSFKNKDAVYYGIEVEKNLIQQGDIDFKLINYDIRDFDSFANASFITSVFTIQFLPQKDRKKVMKNIYKGLNKGAACILCEKIYSSSSKIQDIMTSLYYEFKRDNFTEKEILDKERDLRKIMKLATLDSLFDELNSVGFKNYDVFFRSFNFVGIIAIKD